MMPKKLSKQPTFPGSIPTSTLCPAPPILSDGLPLPRAVIFDLDYTLWPFWVDTHVCAPLRAANAERSAAVDRIGETFTFYTEIPSVLHGLARAGVKIGVASRTHAPDLARELLKLLLVPPASSVLDDGSNAGGTEGGGSTSVSANKKDKPKRAIEFFDAGLEIYPSSKIQHFKALGKKTSIPHNEMLFFDDESRNRDTESLGVTMWLVRDGVSWNEVVDGIKEWRRRKGV
ncbi:magnesium-dependent phosphatase-1 [Hypoxylon trugodes]|uniref:magnesium-dependent phosphatase-1 n=1 Tax=Hypoxylon trugodes TaxID=326681 RepID=UPI00218DE3DC|nr:magnesium-dependent phosphatase-1 [Hypoxylon trugodes]KAI1383395.1 magnesium-dependent phosphatase-1 [Hypoxylon trugodes]